ncbi:MAG: YgiT-type zinc finger protein [Bacteroidetes bacterium]|nr:YgiT-type zinc finger protein [Bacteroidota bacterium]MCW5894761.1 YgiT-type zinc finger protein [Bacteroidota bacterium]
MFECSVCGSNESVQKRVNQVFDVDGKPILVENIPATVCVRCGDATFDVAVGEKIRTMLRGESKPARSIAVDVFDYA